MQDKPRKEPKAQSLNKARLLRGYPNKVKPYKPARNLYQTKDFRWEKAADKGELYRCDFGGKTSEYLRVIWDAVLCPHIEQGVTGEAGSGNGKWVPPQVFYCDWTLVRMVKVKKFVPKPVGSENKQDVTKELSIKVVQQ